MRLEVDASDYGIGGWLYYIDANADEEGEPQKHIVQMGAHLLSKEATSEWDTKTKELHAIWCFVKDWQHLLRGRSFEIITDHANLTFAGLNDTRVQNRRLRFLSEFDYSLVWKPGKDNIVPDCLSRIFARLTASQTSMADAPNQFSLPFSLDSTLDSTDVDKVITEFPKWLRNCKVDDNGEYDALEAWGGAVSAAHEVKHRGINATLELAKRYMKSAEIAIPNDARGSVMAHIANCMACEKLRGIPDKVDLPRNSTHSDVVFKTIQMDFLEGMGSSKEL